MRSKVGQTNFARPQAGFYVTVRTVKRCAIKPKQLAVVSANLLATRWRAKSDQAAIDYLLRPWSTSHSASAAHFEFQFYVKQEEWRSFELLTRTRIFQWVIKNGIHSRSLCSSAADRA